MQERHYWIRRFPFADLSDVNPFQLLAEEVPGAKANIDKYFLAMVARPASAGVMEFLLADSTDSGRGGHSEDLQDLRCQIAECSPEFGIRGWWMGKARLLIRSRAIHTEAVRQLIRLHTKPYQSRHG
ncbi:CDP-diacylglycerol diphosphatase [Bradyrhizobium sp. SBR1B]|uniref:CDP-diacylglycerol diphosphatase n=1 Tax=Bradyrhizobium sp. SBR1B TaxID=2663836 RepID=UPI001AED612B